jgi:enoyl-CoA hydratase/carnithine racemase
MPASLHIRDLPGGVRELTLSHPGRKNALDESVLEALDAALRGGAGVSAWLIRGEGGAFSSGYDLTALDGFPEGTRLPDERLGEVLDALSAHPAPSVALVEGPAVGAGCELAVACDFRVGSRDAFFLLPPAKLGVVYALQGLARVRERIGPVAARTLFLTAKRVDAQEALRLHLLDEVADDARAAAEALCASLAASAPLAMRGMKRGLSLLERGGVTADERAAYEALRRQSFNSDDVREGRAALLERRPPRFTGR